LFTLTFLVTFTASSGTIWRTSNPGPLATSVSLDITYGDLSFSEGSLNVNGNGPTPITTTTATVDLTINLIKGDVDCDGQVTVLDLHDVAYYYDQSTTDGAAAALYDIKIDSHNIIDIYDLVEVASNFGYSNPDSLPS